jgi:mannose/cellobiose epimerase-like protein (N-acyl-D-glucosamine 2-epimerase family)
VFTVLAFALSSTGYIFAKVVRPMVAHLRKDGIKVTVYLDDGLADNEKVCYEQAERVKTLLILSGFVPNRYKCIWKPVQSLVWLGFTWDLKY